MDSEGETDVDIFTDAYQEYATMYSPLEHGYEHDHDDVGPPGYGSSDEYGTLSEEFCAAIVRIPLIILQSVAAALQELPDPPLAWMIAIGEKFPNTDLRKLRSKYPALLPAWLLQGFEFYQVALVLRHGGIFARNSGAHPKTCKYCRHSFKPLSILAATSDCQFREGFSSEGMLCNNPPIPLRVLDFLEHTEDLLNLALVCKATHQAGHVLLHREFPRGLGPGLLTHDDMDEAIKQRKRSMLESALRQPHHPIPSTTASAFTMAAGLEPEACAGAGTEAEACAGVGMEPEACAVENDEVEDLLYQKMFKYISDDRQWDVLDWCMLTLLHASKSHAAGPSMLEPPHPSLEELLRKGGVADLWRYTLWDPIIMDTEAVRRAIAYWAHLDIEDSARSNGLAAYNAEFVMRTLRAADRHAQGVMVLRPQLGLDRDHGFNFPVAG